MPSVHPFPPLDAACGAAWRGFGMMTTIITITTRKGGGG